MYPLGYLILHLDLILSEDSFKAIKSMCHVTL